MKQRLLRIRDEQKVKKTVKLKQEAENFNKTSNSALFVATLHLLHLKVNNESILFLSSNSYFSYSSSAFNKGL